MASSGHSTTSIPRPRNASSGGKAAADKGSGGRGAGGRGSGERRDGATQSASGGSGRGGSSKDRSAGEGSRRRGGPLKGIGRKDAARRASATKHSGRKAAAASRPGGASSGRAAATRDLTKPIPRDKQLVTGSAKRIGLIVGTVVVFAALAFAFFPLPITTWMRQDTDIARKEQELAALEQANAGLANEVDRLKTPEGIEEAAREEIGYVRRGELQLTVLPLPEAPTALPGGWPFDAAAQIVALRAAAAAPAPAVTTPAVTAP